MKSINTMPLAVLLGTVFLLGSQSYAAPQSFADAVLLDNPYAFYRLGESSGTTAADSSGNSRNGSYINAPTLGVAGFGGGDTAVTLNGTNQSISLTNVSGFGSALGSFSMEFLVRTTEDQRRFLLGTINNGTATALTVELNTSAFGGSSPNSTRFFLRSQEGTFFSAAFTNATLFSGDFVHLLFSFNAGGATNADRLQVYVNGASQTLSIDGNSSISSISTFANFDYNLSLGARNNRSNNAADFAAVTFDEAAFYTTALSASAASLHYSAIPEPGYAVVISGLFAFGFIVVRKVNQRKL